MHELQENLDAFEIGPSVRRTLKRIRQRVRSEDTGFQDGDKSTPLVGEEETMATDAENSLDELSTETLIDRKSLCLPDFARDSILHEGDEGFRHVLHKYFPSAESNASERLVQLKSKLRDASTHDFWGMLMEEMCDITGSQCGFVAKRMLVDAQDSAVEMPEYGEPGSCLMAVAFYLNDGADFKQMYRDYRYHVYGTPCAHMRHDKVFIVPERLAEFCPQNPNRMPWEHSEAFIGLPLFSEGKCFAHFGIIWSSDGAAKRTLDWSFIEMFLHSLEDMILQRILDGRGFAKEPAPADSTPAKVIPLSAITASQSLKPYAHSLSHELRTPLQGVVGMLDIIHATVLDGISQRQSPSQSDFLDELRADIEVAQDGSKRAVEAADNMVHAYDLDMQMPETPLTPVDSDCRYVAGSQSSATVYTSGPPSPSQRKRDRSDDYDLLLSPPTKRLFAKTEPEVVQSLYHETLPMMSTDVEENMVTAEHASNKRFSEAEVDRAVPERKGSPSGTPSSMLSPPYSCIDTRDFMRALTTDALRTCHPTTQKHIKTDLGVKIVVETIGSRGELQSRTIHLSIESDVPDVVITDKQHLHFSLLKIVDNAIKFTEDGSIAINVRLGQTSPMVEIRVIDTGCGIAEESRSSLFKPHYQEDATRTRPKDGLGLSLFNAKAHVRRHLGGDVTLERSATDGPSKGSEFLIRLPISAPGTESTNTPFIGTPTPTAPTGNRAWCDPPTTTSHFIPDAMSVLPSTPIMRPSRSRQASSISRRVAFNPDLAKDYPLNILIAEDNVINQTVAVGTLNKLGYSRENITLAFDGVDAVQRYKASLEKSTDQHFNAILMDIWMPNMDGYEATMRIMDLAKEHGEVTTILAITADFARGSIDKAKKAGMHGFLTKPYNILDIQNLIMKHFSKERCLDQAKQNPKYPGHDGKLVT